MEITTVNLTSVRTGLNRIFDRAYHGVADPWFNTVSMEAISTGAEEEYHWLGAVGGMKELIGEISIGNFVRQGWTIRNREWHNTKGIKRADIERDKLGVYTPALTMMGENARMHPGKLVAELLHNGFTSKDYTGKNFFDVDKKAHSKALKFSNKGTHVLAAKSFIAARANLRGRLNAEGDAMHLGTDFVLVVPPALEATALEIVTAEKIGGTTNVNKGTARVLVVPELAAYSDTEWYLIEAGKAVKPIIVQTEKKPTPAMVTNDNDSHVVKHQEYLYQVYGRYNAGYGLPELAYGSTGADAIPA